ncbi:MAG: PIN domain-containing protein [Rhodospirillales bacterium]|nr:PIN domain-containing protein [Rhodospirillales bacterium]
MDGAAPVFSSDRPIEDESITFVVDTNILIEFQSLERINWKLLCPRARSVRVVVPATVISEMDNHKRGRGRLRRRAFEFKKLLQAIEDGDGANATLRNDHVELSLRLMKRYARKELDEGRLSFEVPDELIVAEAAKFTMVHGDAVFLADDTNARRAAREMGIRVARPAEEWRRTEPKDGRDERIEELERQVGAMPRLSLCLLDGEEGAVAFETLDERAVPAGFLAGIGQAILERNPGVERDNLLQRHNLTGVRTAFSSPFSVTVEQVDRYREEYHQYREHVIAWSKRLPETLKEIELAVPIRVQVRNDGKAFAEDVEITLQASKGHAFLASESVKSLLQREIEAPEPPTGIGETPHVLSFFEQQELHRRDPFAFHVRNAPGRDQVVPDVSFECQQFRHHTSNVLEYCLIRTEDARSGGALTIRASSASLADPVEVQYPIIGRQKKTRSTDFKSYFRRRLFLFPEDLEVAVSKVLAEHSGDD